MYLLIKVDNTIQRTPPDGGPDVTLPDIKIPGNIEDWGWQVIPTFGFQFYFKINGERYLIMVTGPIIVSSNTYYLVGALLPKVRTYLENQLGSGNVWDMIERARNSAAVRAEMLSLNASRGWFRPIRNSNGNVVSFYPTNIIAGYLPENVVLGDEDLEAAVEIPGLDGLV